MIAYIENWKEFTDKLLGLMRYSKIGGHKVNKIYDKKMNCILCVIVMKHKF